MAKKSWDAFVVVHPNAICVFTGFAWKVPSGHLAADGRKFPAAYGMLVATLEGVLKGDWTIRSERKGKATAVHIVLADRSDLALVGKLFHVFQGSQANTRNLPAPCAEAHQFSYDPSDYERLAKRLGYAVA